MSRFDSLLAYAACHRLIVCFVAAVLVVVIAWGDWTLPNISVGFLYIVPILLAAPALNRWQIIVLAFFCACLREACDPLQGRSDRTDPAVVLNPAQWVPGSAGRLLIVTAGFAMTGFFVSEFNRRRTLLVEHLAEREEQMRLRLEAEHRVRMLIETSPLAILTVDRLGRVQLANESAARLLGFEGDGLPGEAIAPYLPILPRMLNSHRSGGNIRTNVECKG